ncbi:MAG: YesL family protein [Lachnospiraceae bacterium]|nr:YesL family protein [Lachnospiraceae bacterium]
MLERIFDVDNPVWRAVDKVGKIFLLNLVWVICSLPVFTMGAATTALMYSSMKLQLNEGYWYKNFFHSFAQNFKQATGIFLLYLVVGILLVADFILGGQQGGTFGMVLQCGAGIIAVPYLLSLLYVFGVQAKFVNPVKATIRYAFFMALHNLKGTIQMVLLMALFIWVNTLTQLANYLTIIYGFGLIGYCMAAYQRKAFEKYIKSAESPAEYGEADGEFAAPEEGLDALAREQGRLDEAPGKSVDAEGEVQTERTETEE